MQPDVKVGSGTREVGRAVWRRELWCAVIAAWAVMFGGFGVRAASAQTCMYEIVADILNPTCEGGIGIGATAINDHNIVVGFYFPGCGFDRRPFMWSEETGLILIPLPPGVSEAQANDVNSNGEIVGWLTRPALGQQIAFQYKDGVWTELPLLPGYPIARANAISDDGLIVGEAFDPNALVEPFRAVQWNDGVISVLQLPLGPNTWAEDVNRHSVIVGLMGDSLGTTSLGFMQIDGETTEIPPVADGDSCEARAVNNHNVVTGQTWFKVKSGTPPSRSWVFENGRVTDVGALPEADHRVDAFDINDAGQVVGRSEGVENSTSRPFLWQHGQIFDLQSLIVKPPPGLNLSTANAINNNGWIAVGRFVLRPLDRPLGDVNIDCVVDERDVIDVIKQWGPVPGDGVGPADLVTSATFQPPGDGVVDAADLAVVLGNWSEVAARPGGAP
jgi:probable HAF family extracellular repeat protein